MSLQEENIPSKEIKSKEELKEEVSSWAIVPYVPPNSYKDQDWEENDLIKDNH